MSYEKRPRWYAARILERPADRRAELLARVPEHLQALVQAHIKNHDMLAAAGITARKKK